LFNVIFSAEKYADDPFLLPMLNSGWDKVNKYYDLSDATPVYTAAIVFDPSLKWQYIDSHWNPQWVPRAREAIQTLWDDFKPTRSTALSTSSSSSSLPRRAPNSFAVWMRQRTDQRSTLDEYERYCLAPRIWAMDNNHSNKKTTPPWHASLSTSYPSLQCRTW
jgi:hypothetical protein